MILSPIFKSDWIKSFGVVLVVYLVFGAGFVCEYKGLIALPQAVHWVDEALILPGLFVPLLFVGGSEMHVPPGSFYIIGAVVNAIVYFFLLRILFLALGTRSHRNFVAKTRSARRSSNADRNWRPFNSNE
jgi:hypothetical protein